MTDPIAMSPLPLAEIPGGRVTLRPGRDKPVRQRHPWVFSGAIATVTGDPLPGAMVEVTAADGAWLARGMFSPASQIVVCG